MIEENNAPAVAPEVTPEATPEADHIEEALKSDDDRPTTVDTKPEEPTDAPAEQEVEQNESDVESESEGKPEPEQEGQEEGPDGEKPIDPKEEARMRYEERQRAREEREQRIQHHTKPYLDEAEDDTERRLRGIEIQEFNRTVEQTEDKLVGEFERAKANPALQIFNPENKEAYSPEIYDYAMRTYNDAYVQYEEMRDERGRVSHFPVGLKKSLYQHLTETADLYKGAIKTGQVQQVRAQRSMNTTGTPKPAVTPPKTERDPIMEELMSD